MSKIKILTQEEIELRKDKTKSISKSDYLEIKDKYQKHSDKWDFFNVKTPQKQGQFFLYEIICEDYKNNEIVMSYPKLGVYVDCYAADQTIELEWFNYRRTWEHNTGYETEYELHSGKKQKITRLVCEKKTELQYMILWGDQMLVYGVWDSMPNWKQLKQAYENTWWFYRDKDELRDIKIDRILNA